MDKNKAVCSICKNWDECYWRINAIDHIVMVMEERNISVQDCKEKPCLGRGVCKHYRRGNVGE